MPNDGGDPVQSMWKVVQRCRARFPDVEPERQAGNPPCLLVRPAQGDPDETAEMIIGVIDTEPTQEVVEAFVARAREIRRDVCTDPQAVLELVCLGPSPRPDQRRSARKHEVRLIPLNQFAGRGPLPPQRHLDLSEYVVRQSDRLKRDSTQYPSDRYVPQRYRLREAGDAAVVHEDLLEDLLQRMASDDLCFVTLLSDAGRGKTFLLRELALRLVDEVPDVQPVLIRLTARGQMNDIPELVRLHLLDNDGSDVPFDPDSFTSALEHGQIALLLDGFDELGGHITFDNADSQLQPLLRAARGRAKIVVAVRAQHVEDERKLMSLMHQSDQQNLHRGSWTVSIEDFREDRMREFLERSFSERGEANRWLQKIQSIPWLAELSRNPRMLSLIVDELAEPGSGRSGFPSRTPLATILQAAATDKPTALLERLIDMWLGAEDNRFTGTDGQSLLTGDNRLKGLTQLAVNMWLSDGPAQENMLGHGDLLSAGQSLISGPASLGDAKEMAHTLASATLLVRRKTSWTFISAAIKEYLVTRHIAAAMPATHSPAPSRRGRNTVVGASMPRSVTQLLDSHELTTLMIDILRDSNRLGALHWADRARIEAPDGSVIGVNAMRVFRAMA